MILYPKGKCVTLIPVIIIIGHGTPKTVLRSPEYYTNFLHIKLHPVTPIVASRRPTFTVQECMFTTSQSVVVQMVNWLLLKLKLMSSSFSPQSLYTKNNVHLHSYFYVDSTRL